MEEEEGLAKYEEYVYYTEDEHVIDREEWLANPQIPPCIEKNDEPWEFTDLFV